MKIYKPFKAPKNREAKSHCKDCRRYWGHKRCPAFPDGIPSELLNGEHDHWNSYPDDNNPKDNGVIFKPKSSSQSIEHKYDS